MRRLRKSERGLTFSLSGDSDTFSIGSHYRYMVDTTQGTIKIVPSETGNTVSRKKVANTYKALFDIRSKEIRKLVRSADYLELEECNGYIIVRTIKKPRFQLLKQKKHDFLTITGAKQIGEFTIPVYALASGGESITVQSYGHTGQKSKVDWEKANRELPHVYKVCSLFSGAGLLDYPFHKDPSFDIVYACDFDEAACESYRINIGPHIQCDSITNVTADMIDPNIDVVIGGPCCQAFSNANRCNRDTEQAEQKRSLVDEYIRIVKEISERSVPPKVFCIENVPQLLTAKQGEYLNRVLTDLSDYEITYQLVQDSEFGGYTTRKRAIIIGSKIGAINLEKPDFVCMKTVKDALSKVNSTWYNYSDVTNPSETTQEKMSFVPQGGNWKNIPPEIGKYGPETHSNIMYRLDENGLAPTICNWRKSNLIHPHENRILSVAEASALQGFDHNIRFMGSLDRKQQQVGNSVPYAIANAIKNAVKSALDKFSSSMFHIYEAPAFR